MPNYRNLGAGLSGLSTGLMQGIELADRRKMRNLQERRYNQYEQDQDRRNALLERQSALNEQRQTVQDQRQGEEFELRKKGLQQQSEVSDINLQNAKRNQASMRLADAFDAHMIGNTARELEILNTGLPENDPIIATEFDPKNETYKLIGKDRVVNIPGQYIAAIHPKLNALINKNRTGNFGKFEEAEALSEMSKYFDLSKLTAQDKEAIKDGISRGMTYDEIAQALKVPKGLTTPEGIASGYQESIDAQRTPFTQRGLARQQSDLEEERQKMKEGLRGLRGYTGRYEGGLQRSSGMFGEPTETTDTLVAPESTSNIPLQRSLSEPSVSVGSTAPEVQGLPVEQQWQKQYDDNRDGRINQQDKSILVAMKAVEVYDNAEDPKVRAMIDKRYGPLEMERFRALKSAFQKKVRGDAEKHVGLMR